MSPRKLREEDPPEERRPGVPATGRMISKGISDSEKFASLSPNSMVLFSMLIPHWSPHGKMRGDLHFIKGEVCSLIDWLDVSNIERCLREITLKTNVKWFQYRRRHYLHSLSFFKHNPGLLTQRKAKDTLPSYLDWQHLPENDWSSAAPSLLLQNPSVLSQFPSVTSQIPPSPSTSPSTSTSEVPIKVSTTTRDSGPARVSPPCEAPKRETKRGSGPFEAWTLTPAALAGIVPDVDDEAVHALITACRAQEPRCTDAEIAHALHKKFHRAKQLKTRNLVGFLLVAVPKTFVGDGYKNLQRSLGHGLRLSTSDDDYRQAAVEQLELFIAGKAPRASAETWLPYLESLLASGDVPESERPRLKSLCSDVRELLPTRSTLPMVNAARGP